MNNVSKQLSSLEDKGVTICISIASNPGILGKSIHNAGYEILGIPFIYIPLQVEKSELENVFCMMREREIRGCSVSMPHKISSIPYLDGLSETSAMVGAVNTIVKNGDRLIGDNTDVFGAKEILRKMNIQKSDSVVLLGSGGAAAAVACALRDMGISKTIFIARNKKKADQLCNKFDGAMALPWDEKDHQHAELLINATPVGFGEYLNKSPILPASVANYGKIFDLVPLQAETMLVKLAKDFGRLAARGIEMAIEQSLAQFKIYTGKKAPRELIIEKLQKSGVIQ